LKYLFLIFFDEKKLDSLPEKDIQALTDESLNHDDDLKRNGHLLTAQALQSVQSSTTVRLSNGKLLVTDGPFAETTEQIGGFLLIDARDLNEAIQLASRVPSIRLGGVEIRPIKELMRSGAGR
jgi:hypothetical protein